MARNVRTTFLYVVFSIFVCAFLSHHYLHRDPAVVSLPNITTATALNFGGVDDDHPRRPPPTKTPPNPPVPPITTTTITSTAIINHAIHENLSAAHHPKFPPQPSPLLLLSTVSLLLPDWEVLLIVSPEHTPTLMTHPRGYRHDDDDGQYLCLFPNNDISPATPAGFLHFPDRATFKCVLPERIRRRLPFPRPVLTKNRTPPPQWSSPAPEMFRWTYMAYDSLTTEDDVVVFAKGLNHRQGINREPSEFKCVFYRGDDVANGVRTAVTNSMQEVFRCQRPSELNASFPLFSSSSSGRSLPSAGEDPERIKVTLETVLDKRILPSVAYYNPPGKLAAKGSGRALLCACTMVYNVAKFLKEWVVYHSKIGVQRFLLYDNGSDDNLKDVVEELVRQGYDVNTYFWYWPKAQEAGFSHSAVYAKDSCTWTAYIDVDEFIYSPSWFNSASPSSSMLHSLLTLLTPAGGAPDDNDRHHHHRHDAHDAAANHNHNHNNNNNERSILTSNSQELASLSLGQVHIGCHEFGPSNRTEHPAEGVMQGYNCRKQHENRHKSIVLLDAVDNSLLNVIHHFSLKPGYCPRKLSIREAVVNHYKFQAWPEFKTKFRRRVSAYVVDWTQQVNFRSNDRTPGLGFSAVEPEGWPGKFCEVLDNGLRDLTRKWFALEVESSSSSVHRYKMAWQR